MRLGIVKELRSGLRYLHYSALVRAALAAAGLTLAISGCTVHPRGEAAERALAREAGAGYVRPYEKRELPALKADAGPEELARYALLANGEVEAKYWEWRAALEKVEMEGTQKAGVELSLESMIMSGRSALADTTVGLANAMTPLAVPSKLGTAAAAALHEAQAAGRRFDMARWALRNQVLAAYYDYALTAEKARLEDANTRLLDMIAQVSASRVATGKAEQAELIKAENEAAMSRNTAAGYRGRLPEERAVLNGLLSRDAAAALEVPAALPALRPLTAGDAELLAAAARDNPELQALAHEAAGDQDALRRARLEYLPDFNVGFSTDLAGMTQKLMGSLVLPYLRYEAIDARIRQAEAGLRQTDAMQRQAARNVAARVVGDLAMMREAQRQIEVLEGDLIPRARREVEAAQAAYGSGNGMMIDLLDAQRSILVLRRMAAEMKIEREKQIADLEEVCGGLLE